MKSFLLVIVATAILFWVNLDGLNKSNQRAVAEAARLTEVARKERKRQYTDSITLASNLGRHHVTILGKPELPPRVVGTFDLYLVNENSDTSRVRGARYTTGATPTARNGAEIVAALESGASWTGSSRNYVGSHVLAYVRPLTIGGKKNVLVSEVQESDVELPAAEIVKPDLESVWSLWPILAMGVVACIAIGISSVGSEAGQRNLRILEMMLRMSGVYLAVTNEARNEGRVLLASHAMEELTGIPHEEIVGMIVDDLHHDPEAHRKRRIAGKFNVPVRLRKVSYTSPGGETREIWLAAIRVNMESLGLKRGLVLGFPVVSEDAKDVRDAA